VSFRNAWISGMRSDWIAIEAAAGSAMTVIRFRPGGAFPFIGFPAEAISDTVVPLDVALGPAAASLRDRILEAPTLALKMAAVDGWLLERGRGRLAINPVVEYVTGRLFAPAGLRVSDVALEIGCSQRHMLGLFRRWVGVTPKQYGRIRRFQQVLAHVARRDVDADVAAEDLELRGRPPSEPDWADVAALHGYFDQSHLARDFREFAGATPSGYVAAFRGLVNYLPLD
jgi:AraC-like DNA-binding protein